MTTEKHDAAAMPKIERGAGHMPVLGVGTFQLKGETCQQAVKTALSLGYRHVDTARMYENESQVADGIRASGVPREEIFLTTKLQLGKLDPDGVRQSCENSLRELNTPYVDLLLIHWPDGAVPLEDTLGAMATLKKEGKIRDLGVSNFTTTWLQKALAATDEPIFCNQIEYHPYIRQGPPMQICRENGIAVVAYSPLARGRVAKDQQLQEIGKKHNKTAVQVALRWIVRQQGVAAIPKGSSTEHLRENLDIFDFELDEEDIAAIGSGKHDTRLINPDFAPLWDT